MSCITNIKVWHCVNGDGVNNRQNGWRTHSVRFADEKNSSRMHTACSLMCGGLCLGGLCPGGGWGWLWGGLCRGGVSVRGSLSGGLSVQGVSVPLSRGVLVQGVSVWEWVSVRRGLPDRDPPPPLWTEWHTGVKTLPCRTLLRAVIIDTW